MSNEEEERTYYSYDDDAFRCNCCGELPEDGMNPDLVDLLNNMCNHVGYKLEISCAYRCPDHNAEVGGVENSYHVQGCAADVLVPDDDSIDVDTLAEIAEECGADGIGRYYDSDFVHVDTRGYEARWTDQDE